MTPRQLASEIRVAHEGRDHQTFGETLARLTAVADTALVTLAAVTGRNLASMDRHQLEARRNELHVQLAAVNDRLQAIGATRNGDLASGRIAPIADECRNSLDPSS
jgi:predicted Co/Zn/Cd cation transporter (cation efflux family)